MALKGNDFYIDGLNFFANFLPGALLCFFLVQFIDSQLADNPHINDPGPERWMAFAVASYLLGRFIYLITFSFDSIHERFRRRFSSKKNLNNRTYAAGSKVNLYEWAKVFLYFPGSAVEIQRIEADQKFFRCLTLVTIAISFISYQQANWHITIYFLVLIPISFIRYLRQRRKSNELAFIFSKVIKNKMKYKNVQS